MPIHKEFNKGFFKKWSGEMAYILGFIFADGYVSKNPRGSCYLGLTSTDKEIIEKIRKSLGSNHLIGQRKSRVGHPNWKDVYVLQIGSKAWFEDFKKFGIVPNKSLIAVFPKVPKKFLGDFVRGYFDGDGCVHLGRYWRKDRKKWKWQFSVCFTSGSATFLHGLWKALEKYLAGGHISQKQGGYELVFGSKDSVALFDLMYNNLADELFLTRKRKIFEKAFSILKLRA